MWKIGSSSADIDKPGIIGLILSYVKSPWVFAGFALSAVAAFMWTYSLSKFDFSYASFVGSLSYVFIILISIFIFNETISFTRWIGCSLILIGIIFVVRS